MLQEVSLQRVKNAPASHFMTDYHSSALEKYAEYPLWEKLARSMAYAIKNQDAYDYDGIGGAYQGKGESRRLPPSRCQRRRILGALRKSYASASGRDNRSSAPQGITQKSIK
jgi:hypothetical protein